MSSLSLAIRSLRRRPGLAILAILAFGLGIGLVGTQYSLIDGVLLRPLPLPDPATLMHVGRLTTNADGDTQWQSMPLRDFLEYQSSDSGLASLAGFTAQSVNVSRHGGPPQRVTGSAVTDNFFDVLQVQPLFGRAFRPGESAPGRAAVVVLGYGTWQRDFGADPAVLGHPLQVNGELATVIGVMPQGFEFPTRQELWFNLRETPRDPRKGFVTQVEAVGRLAPGVTPRDVAARLSVVARRLAQTYPDSNDAFTRISVQPVPFAYAGTGTQPLLYTMLAMTVLVLVLGCANVANLLLARATSRVRETAIRAALGANRRHLLAQHLVESLLLAAGGAVLGLVLAALGVRILDIQVARHLDVPFYMRFDLNIRVLAVIIGLTGAAGVLAGFLPAWRASRVSLGDTLHDETRGGTSLRQGRLSRWLVIGQLALASALAIAAGLLGLSVLRSHSSTLPFDPSHLLLGRIELQGTTHPSEGDRVRFYRELVDRVKSLPGVSATAVSSRDLVSPGVYARFEREGQPADRPSDLPGAWLEVVSHEYFSVVNAHPLKGRLFEATDSAGSPPVAIVNSSFARRYWPGEDPIGKRLRRDQQGTAWATVIGIVPDLGIEGVGNNDPPAGWYLLQDQQAWGWLDLLVRTEGDPRALIPAVRRTVAGIDSDQPIHTLTTLSERAARRLGGLTIVGTMAAAFALAAILLASVGIYGITAFSVGRRTREFGVRLALGSTARQLQRLLFRQGSLQLALGLGTGLVLAYVLSLPLAPYLPHVSLTDPALYLGVATLLALVAAAAIWLPTRRAACIDPLAALRSE